MQGVPDPALDPVFPTPVEASMNSSALSIRVFGVYVIPTGITLVFAPNLPLSLFGFAAAWTAVAPP